MKYLENAVLYLSGAIEHGDTTTNWRTEPTKVITNRFGVKVFDPFNDPKQQWVPSLHKAQAECDYAMIKKIGKSFVRKDLGMVDRADFLVAHLPYKVPSVGTHHEIIHANNSKKPTLLVCEQGKQFISPWYYGFIQLEFMFSSWNELYDYLSEVDDGKHMDNDRWAFVYGLV